MVEIHFDLPNYYKPGDGCMSRPKPLKRCDSSLYRHLSDGKIGGQIQNDLVALKVRNGGSQPPDRWLNSGRNNQIILHFSSALMVTESRIPSSFFASSSLSDENLLFL